MAEHAAELRRRGTDAGGRGRPGINDGQRLGLGQRRGIDLDCVGARAGQGGAGRRGIGAESEIGRPTAMLGSAVVPHSKSVASAICRAMSVVMVILSECFLRGCRPMALCAQAGKPFGRHATNRQDRQARLVCPRQEWIGHSRGA